MRSRGETLNAPEPGVEAALLRVALGRDRRDRVLDVGCGSGRLRPVVTDLATEYVGVDTDARVLPRARDAAVPAAGVSWAAADAQHLPFRDASFSAVVVIRVYHRLSDPSAVFGEVARVLRPGGALVLAVVPRSSVALFLRDLWMALREPGRRPWTTCSRGQRVECASGDHRGFVEPLARTRSRLADAGFDVARELGSGYEEFPMLRNLPSGVWIRLGETIRAPNLFPSVFVVAVRRARGSATGTPSISP